MPTSQIRPSSRAVHAERPSSADVREEIQQTRPFRSESQEATIALMRTASVVGRRMARVVEPHGISLAQYNVLRILRGAGSEGLPTLTIRDRMIEEGSTVTRLVDKLEAAGLVSRHRTAADRRQVFCEISTDGLALLAELDPVIDAAEESVMSALDGATRRDFIDMLASIRLGTQPR